MGIGRPIDRITLFTNSECNLDCVYCYTKQRRKELCRIDAGKWKDIILQAKKLGAKHVILAGPGEPLINSINFELIKYINALNMRSIVITNGALITDKIADFLFSYRVSTFFKIPSFNPEIYDLLAGKHKAADWLPCRYFYKKKQINHLIPLGLKYLLDKYNKEKDRRLVLVEAVITKYNIECLLEIARFINVHKFGFYIETLIAQDKEINNLIPTPEEYSYLFKGLKKYLGWRFVLAQRRSCILRKNPVIWENGDMAFCMVESAVIGNISNDTLKNLWFKRISIKEGRKLNNKNIYGFRNCLGKEYLTKLYFNQTGSIRDLAA